MRVLISPDKFKDCLTAIQVSRSISKGLSLMKRPAQPSIITLADGGQGSLNIISRYLPQSRQKHLDVDDPLGRKINASYLWSHNDGKAAFIQMARASGLMLLSTNQRNPMKTSTFGTGQIIRDCFNNGFTQINLFIGGSATNDGGIGMASALTYKFKDNSNNQLHPIGQNLIKIRKIEGPTDANISKAIRNCKTTVYTDVTNPFTGKDGASRVFSPQKGADKAMVQQLQEGMVNLRNLINERFKINVDQLKGSGAAGGLGGGCAAFMNATIKKGIEMMFSVTEFDKHASSSDLIITGEGKLDRSSLQGKVVGGVLQRAKLHSKPLWIVCGISQISQQQILAHYDQARIISLTTPDTTKQTAIREADSLIQQRIKAIIQRQGL